MCNTRVLKVMVLADEANVAAAAAMYNRRMNWMSMRDYLANDAEGRELIEMAVYVGLPPETDDYKQKREGKMRFVRWLRSNGFLVVTKDGAPREEGRYKANVDTLMAIDAMELAADIKPDVVVLITGDADFAILAQKLRRRGIRVEVAAVNTNLSSELRAAGNDVVDMTELFDSFEVLHADRGHAAIGTEAAFD